MSVRATRLVAAYEQGVAAGALVLTDKEQHHLATGARPMAVMPNLGKSGKEDSICSPTL